MFIRAINETFVCFREEENNLVLLDIGDCLVVDYRLVELGLVRIFISTRGGRDMRIYTCVKT